MTLFILIFFLLLGLQQPISTQATEEVNTPKSSEQAKSLRVIPDEETEPVIHSKKEKTVINSIPKVPFYSQFKDIEAPEWKKVGCGIASLAMIINYYNPDAVSVNTLLKTGIKNGAYLDDAGWIHSGLISLGKKYDLDGESISLASESNAGAFEEFESHVKKGPVMASIHYKFDPKSTIPHLVVITGIKNGLVYYNDPAAEIGGKTISSEDFIKAWKKKFIVIRPV